MDESMQDSFMQTKELTAVDKIKIFPRQIRRGKTLIQSTTFFKGAGMESIKIYSQKDPLNVAWGGHPTNGAHLLLVNAKREVN